jgi:hypothetical protein
LDQTISIPKKDIVLERVKVYPLNGKPWFWQWMC